jgi:FkbM family methyltransferase
MIIDLEAELQTFKIPVTRALHVGAHHGEEDEVYRRLDVEPVYIEANPDAFKVLRDNLPNRECHLVAISDRVGIADFHVTSFDQSSSLLPLKIHGTLYPNIVERQVIQVPCTTLNTLLGQRCNEFDLLNIDIQGAELMALRGATKILPHLKCIVTEINRAELYAGCGKVGELDRFLRPFGFRRVRTRCPYHKSWGDAFYVRREFLPSHVWWKRLKGVLGRNAA